MEQEKIFELQERMENATQEERIAEVYPARSQGFS